MKWSQDALIMSWGPFKNAYELLNLKAVKCSHVDEIARLSMYEYDILSGISKDIIEIPIKYLTYILKDTIYPQRLNFPELVYVSLKRPQKYRASQEICTGFSICCVLLWWSVHTSMFPYPSWLLHWHRTASEPTPVKPNRLKFGNGWTLDALHLRM